MHEDLEILLNFLPTERTEDLDKKCIELKKLSETKLLSESRVRFWVNMLNSDLENLSKKIINVE